MQETTGITEEQALNVLEEAKTENESKIELISKERLMEIVEKTKTLFEEKNSTLEKKVYETKLSQDGLDFLKTYFENDVPWEWSQSIGVVEICKSLDSIKDIKSIYFKGLMVQAICFHLSKFKGTGKAEAEKFSTLLLEPFNTSLGLVNKDTNEIKKIGEYLNYLDTQKGASDMGLDVEYTKKIQEIEEFINI